MNQKTQMEKIINSASYNNTAGLVVLKNGSTVYEKYYNGCTAESTINIFSATKSIISALLGIAIDKGYIKDVNQRVLDFYPEYTPAKENKAIHITTIENILTMTAVYICKTEPYKKLFESDNLIKSSLNLLGGNGKIGEFLYSPFAGAHILSGILAKATGQSVLEFASENLFLPMSVNVPCNIVLHSEEEQLAFIKEKHNGGWAVDPQGINTGSWGLTLSAGDMAKIGQLYLNHGAWNDKQLISSDWIEKSTTEHSRCKQWGNLGYGYLWWLIDENEHAYAAMGDSGNIIYINEKKNIVIASPAFYKQNAADRIKLIRKYIEPAFAD